MSKSLFLILGLAIGSIATLLLARQPFAAPHDAGHFPELQNCRPGPWGELTKQVIHLGLLDDESGFWDDATSPTPQLRDNKVQWTLPGYDERRVRALLSYTDLGQAAREELIASARFEKTACILAPTSEFVLDLSPKTRRVVYEELVKFNQNEIQAGGVRWPIEEFEGLLRDGGWQKESCDLIRRLSYDIDGYRYFCDNGVLLSRITDVFERRRVITGLVQPAGLVVRLRLDAASDIEALAAYWGRGRKDITSFLHFRAQDPGGSLIDIVHLLPDIPRNLLYRYPTAEEKGRDCTWTSFNFFNEAPDEMLANEAYRRTYFIRKYHYIDGEEPRFGDMILLGVTPDDIRHTCIYIADDIVFTKNGASRLRPWKLDTLEHVRQRYFRATLMRIARRNDLPDKPGAPDTISMNRAR